jgi:D-alanine transaminase
MTQWIWMNGQTIPMDQARIGVEDRGFQFADGVYEVIRVYEGQPFALNAHLARLWNSAAGIRLNLTIAADELAAAIRKFIELGGVREGMIYLQATRGVAPRNHAIPEGVQPTLLFYSRPLEPMAAPGQVGVSLISVEDERWKRCWVKSIALLPNVLAKTAAIEAGADEAVFVDGGVMQSGVITECCASNFFAVMNGALVTHPVGARVLPGITRALLLDLARGQNIPVQERPLTLAQAKGADEVFISSTVREINFVHAWDGVRIADGRPGPVTLSLHRALHGRIREECPMG